MGEDFKVRKSRKHLPVMCNGDYNLVFHMTANLRNLGRRTESFGDGHRQNKNRLTRFKKL